MSTTTTSPGHRPRRPATPRSHPKLTSRLSEQFRELRLPMFREHFESLAEHAAKEPLSPMKYLSELTDLECQARRESRIARLMHQSRLPASKTWHNFQWTRLPLAVSRQMESLRDGSFLDRRENLLLFGKPGSGKSHCLCALGEQLVHQGRPILFTTCSLLVQELLLAKRDLRLAKAIKRLLRFDGLIIDDLGYVQQSREEMEVLFTLLAERYERLSVGLTTNLVFSDWERIFKDPMTTLAAIDRVVHHSVILDLMGMDSYRAKEAGTGRERGSNVPDLAARNGQEGG
jgi:DNA replication protein DnaC